MVKVLDHGYVELIETWGSQERIIEAARMSTDKGFQGWGYWVCNNCGIKYQYAETQCAICKEGRIEYKPGDEKLLAYLYNHKHMTPFEMAGMTIEIQAPIFVFREWHRHRTQSYNELSARYTPIPDLNYIPSFDRILEGSRDKTNKQAMGTKTLEDQIKIDSFRETLSEIYKEAELAYQDALSNGIPKELARLVIPVGRYSRMRASANLRNWLAFLSLRCDPSAQWEIRQYANIVAGIIRSAFPKIHDLWLNGEMKK